MEPYTELAKVYDSLLTHVDYQSWYLYISEIMIKYINNPRTVVELGCGTGKFGAKFSADGFMIYGIDKSIEMLRIASLRAYKNFKIICADMSNFYLSKKVDFIFSVHDTMNYMLTYENIRSVFKSVRSVMHKKSIFMFDITTEYNINKNFHEKVTKYKRKESNIEWSNQYNPGNSRVHSTLKFYKNDGALYIEEHIQRIYTIDEIQELLKSEGFEVLAIYGDYSFSEPKKSTIMINFITRKI